MKKTIIIIVAVLVVIAIIIGVVMYQNKLKDKAAKDAADPSQKRMLPPDKAPSISNSMQKLLSSGKLSGATEGDKPSTRKPKPKPTPARANQITTNNGQQVINNE